MKEYDSKELKESRYDKWEDDDFGLLKYRPSYAGGCGAAFRLVLDFKRNEDQAVKIAIDLFRPLIESLGKWLLEEEKIQKAYLVSIPSSKQGQSNIPCERVCAALAKRYPWLEHLPNALVRTKSVQKSATAPRGQRPEYGDHRKTIEYRGPRDIEPGATLIMVDDVLTRGSTSGACRDILNEALGCEQVLGLFLGRTSLD
jgi:predicted amidophosphoribosyltransferase